MAVKVRRRRMHRHNAGFGFDYKNRVVDIPHQIRFCPFTSAGILEIHRLVECGTTQLVRKDRGKGALDQLLLVLIPSLAIVSTSGDYTPLYGSVRIIPNKLSIGRIVTV